MVILAASTAESITPKFEILVIDDGSTTMSQDALKRIAKFVSQLRIIHHKKNLGYGAALRSGFHHARGKVIFYTDGDAQYDVRELTTLYGHYKPGIGMVNGYKIKRHDPWNRIVLGSMYHQLVKFCFRLPLKDTDCDFRLVEKRVFSKIKLFENSGVICVELVKKINHFGFKIVEVPVNHYDRPSGYSQFFNFGRLYRTFLGLATLWWKLIILQQYDR